MIKSCVLHLLTGKGCSSGMVGILSVYELQWCAMLCVQTGSSQAVSKKTPLHLALLYFPGDLCSSPCPQCQCAGCSCAPGLPREGRASFLFPQHGVLFCSMSVLHTLLGSAPRAPSAVNVDAVM